MNLSVEANLYWPTYINSSKAVSNFAMSLIRDKKHILIWNQTRELINMESFIEESRQLNRSIVLSTEEFDSLTPEHIPLLRNYLKGFNVTIVMVYRELLSQILSNHFEENRFEHDFVHFSEAFSNYFFKIMDDLPRQLRPLEILSDYADVFGMDNVRVIDLVGTLTAGKDIAYVALCEIAGVMCDRPEVFLLKHGNPSYSLIPSQVFSYKNHVHMQKCVFCKDNFAEYAYFVKRFLNHTKSADPPRVVESNLTMLRPYVLQVDTAFRKKFGHMMLYANVSANWRSVAKARTKELDFGAFVTNATWGEWIRAEYHHARSTGRLCNCSLHAVHGHLSPGHGAFTFKKAAGQNATRHVPSVHQVNGTHHLRGVHKVNGTHHLHGAHLHLHPNGTHQKPRAHPHHVRSVEAVLPAAPVRAPAGRAPAEVDDDPAGVPELSARL